MEYQAKSIRTFIGAKRFLVSRSFYRELGFEEIGIDDRMSYFKIDDDKGFYLQDYYVRKWVDNLMVFLEVENVEHCLEHLLSLDLTGRYKKVRISEIKEEPWGKEFFLHDPSGVLWHFGKFKTK